MARERGLYRRKDSPYWWIDVVLLDGRRVCQSTRLRVVEDAEEYLINLKARAYQAARNGLQADRSWRDAVVRYLKENAEKKTLSDDKDHLRKLDPHLSDKRLAEITMDLLWPFIDQRKDVEHVSNATVNRALEIVRRVLRLARDEWIDLAKCRKFGCSKSRGEGFAFSRGKKRNDSLRHCRSICALWCVLLWRLAAECRRFCSWTGPVSTLRGGWLG